jgi:2-oxo-3-hexenedioate decarboxylase
VSVDVAALASLLERAERQRQPIPQLVADHPDLDVEDAYAIQRLTFERRLATGERQIGYKLGLTSRTKQLAMGVDEPLWGRLTDRLLHPEDEPLACDELIHPRVEPELALWLDEDVNGETADVDTVVAATRCVLPALEVLDSRYVDFRFALPDVVADNGSAARIVLGARSLPAGELDWRLEGVVLSIDDDVVETAAGAAVAGHPAAAVVWLARAIGSVPTGSLVLTGGLTTPALLQAGSTVRAEFTSLGSVSVRIA